MTFTSAADEVFYYLQGLGQKSDILDLLPMAAYVVRADGVVFWYNARAAELWIGYDYRPSIDVNSRKYVEAVSPGIFDALRGPSA
jgi:hypothetical protein